MVAVSVATVLAVTAQTLQAVSSPQRAEIRLSWNGQTVAMTPFDLKIMGSGFYTIREEVTDKERRTIQEIFNEAATFQYSRDPEGDMWQDPSITEKLKRGDCEDMAVWVYRELKRSGYDDVRIMVGKFELHDKRFHTWVVCRLEGADVIIDPALQRGVWLRAEISTDLYLPAYSFDGRNKYTHTLR